MLKDSIYVQVEETSAPADRQCVKVPEPPAKTTMFLLLVLTDTCLGKINALPFRHVKHSQPIMAFQILLRFTIANKILKYNQNNGFFVVFR